MKNPMAPAGIESANYRFVAQHLNQCATAVLTLEYQHDIPELPEFCCIQRVFFGRLLSNDLATVRKFSWTGE